MSQNNLHILPEKRKKLSYLIQKKNYEFINQTIIYKKKK